MKQPMFRILGLFILSIYSIETFAFLPMYFTVSGIKYMTTSNSTVQIIGNNYTGSLVIPSCVLANKTYDVTGIAVDAFQDCHNIVSVTIPKSILHIDDAAFVGAGRLQEIIVDSLNPEYASKNGILFNKDLSKIIAVPTGKASEFVVPNYVTSIGNYAFSTCRKLKFITLDENLRSIGTSAFEYCDNLSVIVIPNNVSILGDNAFSACENLNSVVLGSNISYFGTGAFSGCLNLSSVTIPEGITSIPKDAFSGCSAIQQMIIPNSVISIGTEAFCDCNSLTSCTIPDSIKFIGYGAFSLCGSFGFITIPKSVTYLGQRAFAYSQISGITIQGSISTIPKQAFQDCWGLNSVTLPSTITEIDSMAFNGCMYLKSVYAAMTIPATIQGEAFDSLSLKYSTLYVPKGCYKAYSIAPVWKNFKRILEYEPAAILPINKNTRKASITIRKRNIVINNYTGPVDIYTIDGRLINHTQIERDSWTFQVLNAGIYVVKTKDSSSKIRME